MPVARRRDLQGTGGVCEAGGWCEQGSKTPTRCYPGTYNPNEGADEATDCLTCPAGEYCIGTLDPTTSGLCNAGYWCDTGSSVPNQHICSAGTFCVAGSDSESDCLAGTYNPFKGQDDCLDCEAGYFCDVDGMSDLNECPTGHYCPALSQSGTANPCPAGTYRDIVKGTASTDCFDCPPGKYCLQGSSTPTGDCDPGYYCKTNAEVAQPPDSAPDFGPCPAGHYCPAGTGDPFECPPGTFLASTGNTIINDCDPCTAGFYCDEPGADAADKPCPAGYYCPQGTDTKYPATECAEGQECPEGSSTTTECLPGFYQNAP